MRSITTTAVVALAVVALAVAGLAGPSGADEAPTDGPLICVTPGPVHAGPHTVTPPPVCLL